MEQPQAWSRRLSNAAWQVFVACLLVWLGVRLLAQVWPWLLGLTATAFLGRWGWSRWQASREQW